MRKWLAALLAAIMALSGAALAEADFTDLFSDEDFGFEFMDDGYSGSWVSVDALGFEFCLPEGWTQVDPEGGAAFAATGADGTASLTIRLAAGNVENLTAWGEANLNRYETDEANFYDALVVEEEGRLTLYAVISDQNLIAFEFSRADSNALPREFALQIVGSACVLWDDIDVPFMEGDGDFDFGEAFEADTV